MERSEKMEETERESEKKQKGGERNLCVDKKGISDFHGHGNKLCGTDQRKKGLP